MTTPESPETAWSPLEGSSHAVALEILRHGPAARTDLARRLGLSSASLTRLTRPLLASGMLRELDAVQGKPMGRPSLPLDLEVDAAHFIGVKLVAGRFYAVVTDLRGQVHERFEGGLDTSAPENTVRQLADHVSRMRRDDPRIAALGVSVGGAVSGRRIVERSELLGWGRVDLADELTRATGLPSHIENDVTALTQAEHWFGEQRELDDFMLLTVGVGVGGGLVFGGRQVTGAGGTAGTISHIELDPQGPVCSSGHTGCGVTTITSAAVARRVGEALGREVAFDEAIASTDPRAQAVVAHAAFLVGKLAGIIASILAPQSVLIAGDGIGILEHHHDDLQEGFEYALPRRGTATQIEIKRFDFWNWARGAAVVAVQMHVSGY